MGTEYSVRATVGKALHIIYKLCCYIAKPVVFAPSKKVTTDL